MKTMINKLLYFLVAMIFLTSCAEEISDPMNSFLGKDYDQELIGTWKRTSMIRDINNSITLVTDKIRYREGNTGYWDRLHFDKLKDQQNFTFYTEQDSLYIQLPNHLHKWRYMIKEDTLIVTSFIPDSLRHIETLRFTSKFIKE